MNPKRKELIQKANAINEQRRRKAQKNFWDFCLYYDYSFFEKRAFLKVVANAFHYVYKSYCNNKIRRIAISMPPRAGKSYISSLFVAWMLGKFPKESVMRNCCSDTLYQKFSYDTRDIVRSLKYKNVFSK